MSWYARRCWPPAVFDLQGQPAPKPEADGRVQLPKETKISLVMVTSPEGKRYYLGFSDWDAVHEWQKAQPKAAQQIILLRFDDYANMIAKKRRGQRSGHQPRRQ